MLVTSLWHRFRKGSCIARSLSAPFFATLNMLWDKKVFLFLNSCDTLRAPLLVVNGYTTVALVWSQRRVVTGVCGAMDTVAEYLISQCMGEKTFGDSIHCTTNPYIGCTWQSTMQRRPPHECRREITCTKMLLTLCGLSKSIFKDVATFWCYEFFLIPSFGYP